MNGKIRKNIPAAAVFGIIFVILTGLFHGLDVSASVEQSGHGFLMSGYVLLFLLLTVFLVFAGFLLFKSSVRPERSFFVTGLFLGLFFMAVMPGISAPDEISHYITAYRLSDRMMGLPELDETGHHIQIRPEDNILENMDSVQDTSSGSKKNVLGDPVSEETYRSVCEWDSTYGLTRGSGNSDQADVRTTPLVYIPQAVGITVARVLNLNSLWLLFLGKLMNLLVYLFLTSLAIRKAPFGKELIFGTGLLPMTLHLSSSMSYDTMILGASFLLISWILNLAYETKKVEVRDMAVLCILIAVMGPCKMVYSLLLFLFFLIPENKFGSRKKKMLSFAAMACSLVLAMALVNASVIRSYAAADTGAGVVVQNTKAGYTVAELLHRPVFVLEMLCRTAVYQGEQLHLSMIGEWLGNLDPVMGIPYFLSVAFSLGLLALAFRKPEEKKIMTGKAKIWCGLIILGIVLLTAGAMFISWTGRDSLVIEGLQGRYFLPMLPLFLILLKNDRIVLTKDTNRNILFGFVCMDAYALLRLYATACLRL